MSQFKKNYLGFILAMIISACSINNNTIPSKISEPSNFSVTNYLNKGESEKWTTSIINGIAISIIRATNYDNVSLRVVCDKDGEEKLIITTLINGLQNLSTLNGTNMPLQFYFDNKQAININSHAFADEISSEETLGHQTVSVTPYLLSMLKSSNKLQVINKNERHEFLLTDAKSTIEKMQCFESLSSDNKKIDSVKINKSTISKETKDMEFLILYTYDLVLKNNQSGIKSIDYELFCWNSIKTKDIKAVTACVIIESISALFEFNYANTHHKKINKDYEPIELPYRVMKFTQKIGFSENEVNEISDYMISVLNAATKILSARSP